MQIKFTDWMERRISESWIVGDRSRKTFGAWKDVIKKSSQFMRNVSWKDARKVMEGLGQQQHYSDLAAEEMGAPKNQPYDEFMAEWASKMFLRMNSDILLAKVDPCKLMEIRTLHVSKPQPGWYEKILSEEDVDPGLPLVMVVPRGISLFDGNHRIQAACSLGQPGYAAIAYFMNYESVKPAILDVVES